MKTISGEIIKKMRERKDGPQALVVETYQGDRELERGLQKMAKNGYVVQSQNTRKAAFSAAAGVFTRKQIHTVTFVREP